MYLECRVTGLKNLGSTNHRYDSANVARTMTVLLLTD
jgi:hypothetical protein